MPRASRSVRACASAIAACAVHAVQIRVSLCALRVAQAREAEQRRSEVDAARERVGEPAAHVGMTHDQRHANGLLVDVRALAEHAPVRARALAVVGGHDDDRVVSEPEPVDRSEHLADVLIDVADAVEVVVLIHAQLRFVERPEAALHGRLRRQVVGAIAARQLETPVFRVQRRARHAEHRRAGGRAAVAARVEEHDVVGVHEVHREEPRLAFGAAGRRSARAG